MGLLGRAALRQIFVEPWLRGWVVYAWPYELMSLVLIGSGMVAAVKCVIVPEKQVLQGSALSLSRGRHHNPCPCGGSWD
jgi:hypothetical protein